MPSSIPPSSTLCTLDRYSFSDEAAHLVTAARSDMQIQYGKMIADIWRAVGKGMCGLIPFENSSAGVVWPHLDELCTQQVRIIGEVGLQVRMCVGGIDRDLLCSAEVACSHEKGLEQTSEYFAKHSHLRERKAFPSTVEAATFVKQNNDARHIAFASQSAIEAAGLHLLGSDVANKKGDENVTQFFIVEKNGHDTLPDAQAKHHAMLITPENERGALLRIISIIANARVDMTSLHSRTVGNKRYSFFVEMTRDGTPEEFSLMARQLAIHPQIQNVRWLGSWDERWEG